MLLQRQLLLHLPIASSNMTIFLQEDNKLVVLNKMDASKTLDPEDSAKAIIDFRNFIRENDLKKTIQEISSTLKDKNRLTSLVCFYSFAKIASGIFTLV